MYPSQPPTQAPLDYLNQIAPQAPKKRLLTHMQLIVVGVLGVAIVATIILSIVAAIAGNNKPSQHLAARLATTAAIAQDAQPKLKSSELRALNSSLQLYLTNTNRDIVAPLAQQNINITKLDSSVVTAESGAATLSRLEDARLNAVYDNTYAREMAYQLSTVLTLMEQIHNTTSSPVFKTFLESATANLTPIQTQLQNFNATSS